MKANLEALIEKTDIEPLKKPVLEQINRFYERTIAINQSMNLTALTEPLAFAEKHVLDSLFLLPYLKGERLLDLGSGLGVPGLIVKMTEPRFKMTLIDALNKRVSYLNETISLLGLEDTLAIHGRFEDLGREDLYREAFDTVMARAVADLPVLLEYALPFVKVGGYFIAMKGKQGEEELARSKNAITILGGSLKHVITYTLPCGDERRLIIIEKLEATKASYPRKPQQIKKKPLV